MSGLNLQERSYPICKDGSIEDKLHLFLLHRCMHYRCNAYNEGRQIFMRVLRERGLCSNTSNVTSQTDTLKVVCESAPKQLARFVMYCMNKRRDALYLNDMRVCMSEITEFCNDIYRKVSCKPIGLGL